jgi:hypothetical protein
MQVIREAELHVALEHHLILTMVASCIRIRCSWTLWERRYPKPNPLEDIAQLRQVNRAWRIAVDERLEYAALRLAVWDLGQVVGARWFTDVEFLRARFDNIIWRFGRSWTTSGRVPRRIQEAHTSTNHGDMPPTKLCKKTPNLYIGAM